jgi:hypothetical protein
MVLGNGWVGTGGSRNRPIKSLADLISFKPGLSFMEVASQFLAVIDSGAKEEWIHQFLVDHPEILYAALNHSDQIITKPSLHSYVPDFAAGVEGMTFRRWSWTLIEIEPAGFPLLTQAGNPSAKLTHAAKQIADWRNWISENTAYARTILPDIKPDCHGLIVMGRRRAMTERMARELRAYQDSLNGIHIHSDDWLYDNINRDIRLGSRRRPLRIHKSWQDDFDCAEDE